MHPRSKAMRALGAVVFLLCRDRVAFAQALPDPLTIESAVTIARADRREPTAALARVDSLVGATDSAGMPPNPMLMASLDHIPFSGMGASFSFMVEQQFSMSGILGAKTRVARAQADAARSDASATGLDVEAQAARAFVMLAEAQSMRAALTRQAEVAAAIVDVAKARLAGGSGNAADVVRAQTDVAEITSALDAADAEIASSTAMLLAAIGRPRASAAPSCELPAFEGGPLDLQTLVERALAARPELASMRSQTSAAKSDVEVMRSMYAPMGIARLGFAYDMADGPGLMTSFGISIPIWRNELDAGVDSANHMVRMRSEEERAMERMIEGDVAAARERVVGAARRARALRVEILPLAKQTLQLTVASYAGGDLPLVSVLDAASTLREKEMGGVVLDAQTVLAWIELGRAVGTLSLASLVAMPPAEGAP